MSNKPIFVATHPRACSTAFERVFMTRRDILQCVHEPFGDAFYFGPERLSDRYEQDQKAREESGFEGSTYRTIFQRIAKESTEGKRLFIKDITHYLVPPNGKPATIAPSLVNYKRGVGTTQEGLPAPDGEPFKAKAVNIAPYPYDTNSEEANPSVVPEELLKQFHFTFLIRHPKFSIPSYWRCTIPPLDDVTGFYNFMPCEAGYDELRRVFDYLRERNIVGPRIAGHTETTNGDTNGTNGNHTDNVEICVIDADDLLDNPSSIINQYCATTGVEYKPEMLTWDTEEEHSIAKAAFEKWKGFHEDAINSTELKARVHKTKSDDEIYADWIKKYGTEAAKSIKACVDQNVADYEYLKKFAIKP
ncbi:hypothetical protein EJ05DRAFT_48418 [Pseudovirgaria hyperparasitica]|uniref:P-loop containing nucleoside triphosphate hydrolase protein n=1 Tax=Pseudovirgaria hyperparasitica TaxID=470096 RepID=A0A6A6W2X0_9PEZI|nr:uncharacterized protein EJ05DRAFT_48418 [Pseudovirgaria hyperparasitica]KAF2756943.1 hypothetical protein EJ05DRAFT_48418 [Pseudovirgaria hyperparasitica]